VIFCILIKELKLKRILFACPVFIEIFQSWFSSGCFDFPDILFSIVGILFVLTLLFYENRKQQLMN
jgi:glycopeptide antibiotics resistance protein